TNAGAVADHRFPLRPSEIEGFAREVAARLGIQAGGQAGVRPGSVETKWRSWVEPLARDLQGHRGRSLVIAGDSQPPAVHALVHVMNQALGNEGATVVYAAPVEADQVDQTQSLSELARDMEAVQVDLLVIVGGNHVYGQPADLEFAERMSQGTKRIHLPRFDARHSDRCAL